MNHVELYEEIMNSIEVDYEIRSLVKQFFCMEFEKACDTLEMISSLLKIKQADLEILKKILPNDIRHN